MAAAEPQNRKTGKPNAGWFGPFKRAGAAGLNADGMPSAGEMIETGAEYCDFILEHFKVNCFSSQRSRLNMPANGPVIIIANHPISSLDGLALLRFVGEIRPDVKLVSMDLLTGLAPLADRVIAVSKGSTRRQRADIKQVVDALKAGRALIVFPAVKVSGRAGSGKRDGKWSHRFLKLALHCNTPILPVYIENKGRRLVRWIGRAEAVPRIGRRHELHINVGELIPCKSLAEPGLDVRKQSERIRHHLYRIAKGRPGVFATQKAIIHPQPPSVLREELRSAALLGQTGDGHQIYLFEYRPDSAVMREIGRLREYTFRYVGEGTGKDRDLDIYDRYYRHLVLWNDNALEVVGAYRLAEAGAVLRQRGVSGLYCHELFELGEAFQALLPRAVELGRSFVQPKYWGKRSLDYLWYGLGAYVREHSHVRYLYGPVSMSNAYPEPAKQALVRFYRTYFGAREALAAARRAYVLNPVGDGCGFPGRDYEADFKRLKEYLGFFNVKVPTLYKQYTEICEPGGVVFDDFNIDPDFGFCVDGLVRVDLDKLKEKIRRRYIGDSLPDKQRSKPAATA